MPKVINIKECYNKFDDLFSPKVIAELNNQQILAVKVKGEKVPWHIHENEDELFWVIEGVLEIHERDIKHILHTGEFYVVKKGIEHKIVPQGLAKIILFEPKSIAHTGNTKSEITKTKFEKLDCQD